MPYPPLSSLLAQIVATTAARYALPPEIVGAILQVESGGNPLAFRFEPGFLARCGRKRLG